MPILAHFCSLDLTQLAETKQNSHTNLALLARAPSIDAARRARRPPQPTYYIEQPTAPEHLSTPTSQLSFSLETQESQTVYIQTPHLPTACSPVCARRLLMQGSWPPSSFFSVPVTHSIAPLDHCLPTPPTNPSCSTRHSLLTNAGVGSPVLPSRPIRLSTPPRPSSTAPVILGSPYYYVPTLMSR